MPAGSSPKRERQYKHIKSSVKKRGMSEDRAEEIAGYGPDVVVVEPADLRAAVQRQLRGVLVAQSGPVPR